MWRTNIHSLEALINEHEDYKLKSHMLMLRRHEKDYLLRDDSSYLKKHQKQVLATNHYIKKKYNSKHAKTLLHFVEKYQSQFKQFANLRKRSEALKVSLLQKRSENLQTILDTQLLVGNQARSVLGTLNQISMISTIFVTLISFALFYILSRTLSKPIGRLTEIVLEGNIDDNEEIEEISSFYEVNQLRDSIVEFSSRAKEQERVIESSAQMSTIGEVSSNIVHEIMNPLQIIKAYSKSYQRRKEKTGELEFKAENLEAIIKAVDQITNICLSVKKLAKADTNVDVDHFQLENLFSPITFLLSKKLSYSDIKLEIDNKYPDLELLGNEHLLSQVIINLVNNSRQAIFDHEEKWIKITVEKGAELLKIKVIDSGKGISEDISTKLFKERVTTKQGSEGTGLGLPLCHKIITQHGGNIFVDTKAKNTTFVVELPLNTTNSELLAA